MVSISQIFFLISGHEIIYKIIACHYWIVELYYSFITFVEIFTLECSLYFKWGTTFIQ